MVKKIITISILIIATFSIFAVFLSSKEEPSSKNQFIFVPINWDSSKSDFKTTAEASYLYFKNKYIELYDRKFPTLTNDDKWFDERNEPIILTACIGNCEFTNLTDYTFEVGFCVERCVGDKKIVDVAPVIIGITNSEIHKSQNFQEYTTVLADVSNNDRIPLVTHEIGHLFWYLCDEYSYEAWKWQDEDNREKGEDGCPNPYPLCCKDHPQWENNKEVYQEYLKGQGLSENCFAQNGEDETLCAGSVCTPSEDYSQCRSIMGVYVHPDDIEYFFGGKLERRIPIEALR